MALRLAFMGTPEFAVPTLAELIAQGHDIAAVYSQPPRPKGRGMALEPGPVHKFAESAGLTVHTPVSLKGAVEQEEFAALNLDAAIVVAYGLLLPKAILQAPRLGCFNLHGSLLPRWRGAAPIQRAVMAGDEETGVMVMQMDEGLDTGSVLMAERVRIGRKTSGELAAELSRLGADLMVRALGALERGAVTPKPQSADGVTYARKIAKEEARIDWSKSAGEIGCLIRGLAPSPGAFTEVEGERLKILYAVPVVDRGAPGEVITDEPSAPAKA
jgi:methionyl-tRNA formyltransferase